MCQFRWGTIAAPPWLGRCETSYCQKGMLLFRGEDEDCCAESPVGRLHWSHYPCQGHLCWPSRLPVVRDALSVWIPEFAFLQLVPLGAVQVKLLCVIEVVA